MWPHKHPDRRHTNATGQWKPLKKRLTKVQLEKRRVKILTRAGRENEL